MSPSPPQTGPMATPCSDLHRLSRPRRFRWSMARLNPGHADPGRFADGGQNSATVKAAKRLSCAPGHHRPDVSNQTNGATLGSRHHHPDNPVPGSRLQRRQPSTSPGRQTTQPELLTVTLKPHARGVNGGRGHFAVNRARWSKTAPLQPVATRHGSALQDGATSATSPSRLKSLSRPSSRARSSSQ